MRVRDAKRHPLQAEINISNATGGFRVVFESRGPNRNVDYIKAFDLVLTRLAGLSAVLHDATVISTVTKSLPYNRRRLRVDDHRYPIQLGSAEEGALVARALRKAAAAVGRPKSAKGGGNPTKRVEIRFTVPGARRRKASWLADELLQSSISDESRSLEDYVRPRARSRFRTDREGTARCGAPCHEASDRVFCRPRMER